ncbi:OmpA family protein [Acuticoccus sp. MNP-M23]|uniref:OmpA family protein n=1 Tax=Acuticoccus sp. MNP-M23 TaxID=3072793 RepID=UPI0028153F1E|nr:OmpA family protein [Acuticoccus sp. MNP-M23]WMS44151.1 OmpA family protein [Acuticoccus sp. MNP-M23]
MIVLTRFARVAVLGTGLALTAGAASAEDTYSVSDVVKHFSQSANLGKTRALCIGTPTECGAPEAAAAPQPFNLQIQFPLGSAELTPEARQQLDVFAEAATGALSRASFHIDGHTDARGADGLNLTLSDRRANAVVAYLVDKGVSSARLKAEGYGETQPINLDPFAAENRRVEASLADIQ